MSKLLKISRAVDGDDWFVKRVTIACELNGVECSRSLLLKVAGDVADNITVTDDGVAQVDTSAVTDEQLFAAIAAHAAAVE